MTFAKTYKGMKVSDLQRKCKQAKVPFSGLVKPDLIRVYKLIEKGKITEAKSLSSKLRSSKINCLKTKETAAKCLSQMPKIHAKYPGLASRIAGKVTRKGKIVAVVTGKGELRKVTGLLPPSGDIKHIPEVKTSSPVALDKAVKNSPSLSAGVVEQRVIKSLKVDPQFEKSLAQIHGTHVRRAGQRVRQANSKAKHNLRERDRCAKESKLYNKKEGKCEACPSGGPEFNPKTLKCDYIPWYMDLGVGDWRT